MSSFLSTAANAVSAARSYVGLGSPLVDDAAREAEERRKIAEREAADEAFARSLQGAEEYQAGQKRGADRSTRSGHKPARKRLTAGDAAFARRVQAEEEGDGGSDEEVVILDAKVARPSAAAEREAVIPFARHIDRTRPQLELDLPEDELLVNATTFKVLKWGLGGHRDALRSYAPELHELAQAGLAAGERSVSLTPQQLSAHRGEWEQLPVCVPQVPPREGCVYVTHEANDKINVGSELYHRIYVEEGALPKQMGIPAYEQQLERSKESEKASRADRKRFGNTAALGVKLTTVRTARNGDCFFDALCKAYTQGEAKPQRAKEMWCTAAPLLDHSSGGGGGSGSRGGSSSSSGAAPDPGVPLSIKELRGVVAAHFPEEAWLIGQSVGGESFSFIVDDSLDLTKANVAALAEDAADRAYWADESAIAVLQRYLGVRLLIFNPGAAEGNRCQCLGEVPQHAGSQRTYVLLCHTHRTSKTQHYELFAKAAPPGGRPIAVFDEDSLPAGVKRAFAGVCPDAPPTWRTAADPEEAGSSSAGGS